MIKLHYFTYGELEKGYLKKRDELLGAAIDKIGHIKREITLDLFTALVQNIVDQQISTKAAKTIWLRLLDQVEDINPANLARLNPERIQKTGLTMKKARNINLIARMVLDGELNLDSLQNSSDEEILRKLTVLNGVGPWTAEMLMIFSMQRINILSYGDLAIHRGLCRLYNHKKIDKKQFNRYKELYTPYASVASLYLWAIAGGALDN